MQHLLQQLDRPLLCSTAKAEEPDESGLLPDAAVLADLYGPRGLDFIVDTGFGGSRGEGTTILDMTGSEVALVREGRGDPAFFIEEE